MPRKTPAKVVEAKVVEAKAGRPRFFIQMKAHGVCTDKGRVIMGVEWNTKKLMAVPDKPLASLLLPLVEQLAEGMNWSSHEAAVADLEAFQAGVADFQMRKDGK